MSEILKIDPYGFREYDARWVYEKDINHLGITNLGRGLGTQIIKNIEVSFKPWEKQFINVTIKSPKYFYDFYGYHWDFKNDERKKYKFIQLEFTNYRSYNRYKKELIVLFKSKKKSIQGWCNICTDECNSNLYEANIHPILRFIHERKIKPSGWITISGKNIEKIDEENQSFKCHIELKCLKKYIKP